MRYFVYLVTSLILTYEDSLRRIERYSDKNQISKEDKLKMLDEKSSSQIEPTVFKKLSLGDVSLEPTRHGALKRVLLRHEEVNSHLMFLNEVYVSPGETIASHMHEDMEEVILFPGRGRNHAYRRGSTSSCAWRSGNRTHQDIACARKYWRYADEVCLLWGKSVAQGEIVVRMSLSEVGCQIQTILNTGRYLFRNAPFQ
jgi:hypothetical protein